MQRLVRYLVCERLGRVTIGLMISLSLGYIFWYTYKLNSALTRLARFEMSLIYNYSESEPWIRNWIGRNFSNRLTFNEVVLLNARICEEDWRDICQLQPSILRFVRCEISSMPSLERVPMNSLSLLTLKNCEWDGNALSRLDEFVGLRTLSIESTQFLGNQSCVLRLPRQLNVLLLRDVNVRVEDVGAAPTAMANLAIENCTGLDKALASLIASGTSLKSMSLENIDIAQETWREMMNLNALDEIYFNNLRLDHCNESLISFLLRQNTLRILYLKHHYLTNGDLVKLSSSRFLRQLCLRGSIVPSQETVHILNLFPSLEIVWMDRPTSAVGSESHSVESLLIPREGLEIEWR